MIASSDSIEVPPGGSTAAPLLFPAFIEGPSPFAEVEPRRKFLPGAHTAGSRLVLGRFSAGSRRVFGGFLANWFRGSLCEVWKVLDPNFLPEGPRRSPGSRPEASKRLPKAPKSSPRVPRRPPGVSKNALKTRFCLQRFSGA